MPKYYLLQQDILRKIESGEYKEGKMIESERELMDRYPFSRITVRKALDELVNEGYLYRIQGKGTYVRGDGGTQNLFHLNSCTEDVLRLGKTPSKKITYQSKIVADKKRARQLCIPTGDMLHVLGRITLADEEPLSYTLSYLPERIFPQLEHYDLEKMSLYKVMEKDYRIRITKARRTMEAVLPDKTIAQYLEISPAMPIILFHCVTFGMVYGQEMPIETCRCYYRTDHYQFFIDQVNEERGQY